MEKNPHHLVMGELTDYLTGERRHDTHDERYRQKLARYLVAHCGYDKQDIQCRRSLTIRAGDRAAAVKVDFLIMLKGKTAMMIRYAPGSLVTRRLSNLALSRIIHPYQIPVIVTTNGEDAEIVDGADGCVTGQGLEAIPGKTDLVSRVEKTGFPSISRILYEKASRIAYACEIDGACPCDTDVCTLDPDSRPDIDQAFNTLSR